MCLNEESLKCLLHVPLLLTAQLHSTLSVLEHVDLHTCMDRHNDYQMYTLKHRVVEQSSTYWHFSE